MAVPITQGRLGHRTNDVLVTLKSDSTDTPEAVYSDAGKMHVLPYFWNPNTLAWEVSTGGGSAAGGNVTVTNFPSSYPVTGSVSLLPEEYALRVDEGVTYTYIGHAPPGSNEASAVWRIKRMTNSTTDVVYADGDASFNNVWSNRASLAYS